MLTDEQGKQSSQSRLEFDPLACSLESLCKISQTKRKTKTIICGKKNFNSCCISSFQNTPYIDCKLLKSPMAGEISPPRFKLDKFLQVVGTEKRRQENN